MSYLIMSCGGINGTSLVKLLNNKSIQYKKIDSNKDIESDFLVTESCNNELFLSQLLNIIKTNNIKEVIPCSDHDLIFIANNYKMISECLAQGLLLPSKDTIKNFLDKSQAKKIANIIFPDKVNISSNYFVRNRFSYSRPKVAKKIRENELSSYPEDRFTIDPYVTGDEISVDTFLNKDNFISVSARKREDIRGGISHKATFVDDKSLINKVKEFILCNKLYGFCNIQFMRNGRNYHFIECNTRLGGGWSLSLNNGFNFQL